MSIAIIGGGAGGIIALYECKRRKLKAILYEKTSSFGGVWNLNSSEPRAHHSTLFNSSYFSSSFDLDCLVMNNFQSDEKDFLMSYEYYDYLKKLIKFYDLNGNIMYNQEVLDINSRDNQFFLNIRDFHSGRTEVFAHDFVIICTGRNGVETIPTEPFLSKDLTVNKNDVWHSSFWDPLNLKSEASTITKKEDCKILVIGGGHSGAEAIQDTLESACPDSSLRIFWAPTRQPDKRSSWMIGRYPHDGRKSKLPADESSCRLFNFVPSVIVRRKLGSLATPVILHDKDVLPDFVNHVFCVTNTEMLSNAIKDGTIEIMTQPVLSIYRGPSGHVTFDTKDKSGVTIDAVVLATGYKYADIKINKQYILATSKFYRSIIPLDKDLYGQIGFLGTSRILGSSLQILQMEVRWLLYHWFNTNSEWQSTLERLRSREQASTLEGSLTEIPQELEASLDRLATDMGVMPHIWSGLLSINPRRRHVALACLLSPVSMYQYRDTIDTDQATHERENHLLLNTHKSFKRSNSNFYLICYLMDALYYVGAAVIFFKLFRYKF